MKISDALSVPRSSLYRWLAPPKELQRPASPKRTGGTQRALSEEERATVLEILNSDRFVNQSPAQVVYALLDEGLYHCSVRTMYRLLHSFKAVKERRNQVRKKTFQKPELLATGPNQIWSWDITRLKGPVRHQHYYLYVILDLFSRKVVGWTVSSQETSEIAGVLIDQSVHAYGLKESNLILHSDRGPQMTSKEMTNLLDTLGISQSLSRPRISNDNPYSEAQFKTVKYSPGFPERFGSLEGARCFMRDFLAWYNQVHRHSGIAYLTPDDIHSNNAKKVILAREAVLERAYRSNPSRFPRGLPKPPALPHAVWINPPVLTPQSEG